MTRRDWLIRVIGSVAAAAVAPLIDLTDTTPAFWNQEPLKKLLPWNITFPDGTTFSLNATVVAERLLDDGTVSFTLRPTGPVHMSQDISYISEPQNDEIDVPLIHAPATVVHREGVSVMELTDITLPSLAMSEESLGLTRLSDITITVRPI